MDLVLFCVIWGLTGRSIGGSFLHVLFGCCLLVVCGSTWEIAEGLLAKAACFRKVWELLLGSIREFSSCSNDESSVEVVPGFVTWGFPGAFLGGFVFCI